MSLLLLYGGGASAFAKITWIELEAADAVTVSPAPVTGAAGVGRAAWRTHYLSTLPKKKRTLLEELEDVLLELRSQIPEEEPDDIEPEWVKEIRKADAFAYNAVMGEFSMAEIRAQLTLAREIARNLDDEDVLLMSIH